jgi:lipopolysaccharide/colanic/teichoic acid biosynthesis glycosyltransferase
MEYLGRYSSEQKRRHDVRPGITGLAQVSGRNALLFSERLAYDIEYVNSYCFRLDVKILLRTLFKVTTLSLEDRAGQHVSAVDDLGLHPDTRASAKTLYERKRSM